MTNRLLLSLLLFAGTCQATAAPCAHTIVALRALVADPSFPLQWTETSMDDGRPLVLSIRERNGALFIEFMKTDEGLWAEGASVVCPSGAAFEVRIPANQIRVGPAASWLVQYALSGGGQFTLTKMGARQLQVATPGWSGTFLSGDRPK